MASRLLFRVIIVFCLFRTPTTVQLCTPKTQLETTSKNEGNPTQFSCSMFSRASGVQHFAQIWFIPSPPHLTSPHPRTHPRGCTVRICSRALCQLGRTRTGKHSSVVPKCCPNAIGKIADPIRLVVAPTQNNTNGTGPHVME